VHEASGVTTGILRLVLLCVAAYIRPLSLLSMPSAGIASVFFFGNCRDSCTITALFWAHLWAAPSIVEEAYMHGLAVCERRQNLFGI
jgi:hypothetical protein